jgi:outer membrane protein assembly factor BamB
LTLTLAALSAPTRSARADDWPQFLGPQRDGVWRETGIVETFPAGGPPVEWRTPIGAGYAGAAVAGGRVYATDRLLAPGVSNPKNPFAKDQVKGRERVLCLDAAKGSVLWEHSYDCPYTVSYPSGPRATPVVAGGKVYALGTMGDLLCLDAASGKVVWSKNFPKDYDAPIPEWGFAASPLLDGQRLICLVGGNAGVAVAFDKDTGKELWHSLTRKDGNSEVGYAAPVVYDVAGARQLVVWHPEAVNGLDPATGNVYWSVPFKVKANLTVAMPRLVGTDRLFVTSFYNGAMLIQLNPSDPAKPSVVWRSKQWQGRQGSEQPERTDTLHSIMPTPFVEGGYVYGVCSYGELRCLKVDTGERVWQDLRATHAAGWQPNPDESQERWGNAFLTKQGDRYFLFNEKGDLIIAKLSPKGYEEVSRAHLLAPTNNMAQGRLTVWTHPAYADRSMFIRNDKEIIRVSLAAK